MDAQNKISGNLAFTYELSEKEKRSFTGHTFEETYEFEIDCGNWSIEGRAVLLIDPGEIREPVRGDWGLLEEPGGLYDCGLLTVTRMVICTYNESGEQVQSTESDFKKAMAHVLEIGGEADDYVADACFRYHEGLTDEFFEWDD